MVSRDTGAIPFGVESVSRQPAVTAMQFGTLQHRPMCSCLPRRGPLCMQRLGPAAPTFRSALLQPLPRRCARACRTPIRATAAGFGSDDPYQARRSAAWLLVAHSFGVVSSVWWRDLACVVFSRRILRCNGGRCLAPGPCVCRTLVQKHSIVSPVHCWLCGCRSASRTCSCQCPAGIACSTCQPALIGAAGAWGPVRHQLRDPAAGVQEAAQRGEGRQGPHRRGGGGALPDHDVQPVRAHEGAAFHHTFISASLCADSAHAEHALHLGLPRSVILCAPCVSGMNPLRRERSSEARVPRRAGWRCERGEVCRQGGVPAVAT